MDVTSWGVWALVGILAVNTLFILGMALALFMIWRKTDEALKKAEPLLQQAAATLGKVEETTIQVQHKVEMVLDKTTTLVDQVAERVDTTTAIAEEAVTQPLIGAACLVAGLNRGLRTYSERASEKGNGHSNG